MDAASTLTRQVETTTYTAEQLPDAQEWSREVMADWQLPYGYVGLWLSSAADRLPEGRAGRVVLAWDPADRLLTIDVWDGDRRVYGMDDFL